MSSARFKGFYDSFSLFFFSLFKYTTTDLLVHEWNGCSSFNIRATEQVQGNGINGIKLRYSSFSFYFFFSLLSFPFFLLVNVVKRTLHNGESYLGPSTSTCTSPHFKCLASRLPVALFDTLKRKFTCRSSRLSKVSSMATPFEFSAQLL